jgi:hypothetical protein
MKHGGTEWDGSSSDESRKGGTVFAALPQPGDASRFLPDGFTPGGSARRKILVQIIAAVLQLPE